MSLLAINLDVFHWMMAHWLAIGFVSYWLISGVLIVKDLQESLFLSSWPYYVGGFLFAPVLAPWAFVTWLVMRSDEKLTGRKGSDLDPLNENFHVTLALGILIFSAIQGIHLVPPAQSALPSTPCVCQETKAK